jgi:hypothetical protein
LINAAGQLTTYAWDGKNRMTLAVLSDASRYTLAYDAGGLQRQKQVADTTTPSSGTARMCCWRRMETALRRRPTPRRRMSTGCCSASGAAGSSVAGRAIPGL